MNNPFCGDEFHIQLKFSDGSVSQVGINGRGCAISQASASLLAELVEGKSYADVKAAVDSVRRLLKGEEVTEEEQDWFLQYPELRSLEELHRKFI